MRHHGVVPIPPFVEELRRMVGAHQLWLLGPVIAIGTSIPAPISALSCLIGRSVSHSQRKVLNTATIPQKIAKGYACTVSERKNPAVKTAADTGQAEGPGISWRYCGSALIGEVIIVSRRPVALFGRK